MEDQAAVANTILRTISDSRTKTLAGGQIRSAIIALYPGFQPTDYGTRNLRDFIRNFVPAVKEESRAGMDIVYALRDSIRSEPARIDELSDAHPALPAAPPRLHLLGNQQAWKTFANPSSPWKLFWQPETGIVRTFASNEAPDPSWIHVPPCSAEALLTIARAFVEKAPEPFRPVLTQTLTENKWWLPFFEVLRNIGLKTSWINFRRQRIVEEFEETISRLDQLRRNRTALVQEPRSIQTLVEEKAPPGSDALLRKLAIDAIARMSEAELRALNIPIGYIVDSISSTR